MRFNNRSCALMDIPDLPMGAFEHIGDRKIKLQGGGNPVSAVTNTISKAIGTDGSGGGALGALAKVDPGPALGKGLADVDKFVGREIPGGWKTVGITAAAIAAPYAYSALASSGAGAAGTAAAGEAGFAAANASSLAAGGLSEAAIAQNLVYSGVSAGAAADAAALAASGLSEAAIAQNLAYAYNAAELGGSAIPGITASGGSIIDKSMALEQMGPTYQELGITGVEGGMAGPTYGELGYTGLNPGSAPSAAAYSASGMSAAQKAMMGMQLGQGLLGRPMPQQQNAYQQQVARKQMPNGQVDYSGLLALLQPRSAQRKTSLLG